MARKFLIVGGSGFVGRHLAAALQPGGGVATACSRPLPGTIRFDAVRDEIGPVLRAYPGISHAVLLHGITNQDRCARDPAGTGVVNVDAMKRLVRDLVAAKIHPIYVSSDAVFDGSRGGWTEDDQTCPNTVYGAQKADMEAFMARLDAPWTVVRFSKVVSPDPGTHSLFGEWLEAIWQRRPIRAARDQIFSPALVDDVVHAIISLADRGHGGLYNLCGPRGLSRLELLEIFIDELSRHMPVDSDVVACSLHDFEFAEKRPLNSSLSPLKLYRTLGAEFRDMVEVCRSVAQAAADGQRGARLTERGIA